MKESVALAIPPKRRSPPARPLVLHAQSLCKGVPLWPTVPQSETGGLVAAAATWLQLGLEGTKSTSRLSKHSYTGNAAVCMVR